MKSEGGIVVDQQNQSILGFKTYRHCHRSTKRQQSFKTMFPMTRPLGFRNHIGFWLVETYSVSQAHQPPPLTLLVLLFSTTTIPGRVLYL